MPTDRNSSKPSAAIISAPDLVTGLEGEDFVSRLLVELDPAVALPLHLAADRPLKAEDLATVPRDATLAFAARVDPMQLLAGLPGWRKRDELRPDRAGPRFVAGAAPRSGTPAAGAAAEGAKDRMAALDEKLCREIAASLGDAWSLFTSPGEGMLLFTGVTGTARVKDHDRLAKALEKLAAVHQPPGAAPAPTSLRMPTWRSARPASPSTMFTTSSVGASKRRGLSPGA